MKKRYTINPNTIEKMEEHYSKLTPLKERFNEWMIPYLSTLLKKKYKSILEIGCGMGKTLKWIREQSPQDVYIEGHDLSPLAISEASKEYKDITFKVKDSIKWEPKAIWDLIICSQTLEHVDDPKILILNMKKALKIGGCLFITVPYPGSSLDRGVKLHHWTLYPQDFKTLLGISANCIKEGKRHLIIKYIKNE